MNSPPLSTPCHWQCAHGRLLSLGVRPIATTTTVPDATPTAPSAPSLNRAAPSVSQRRVGGACNIKNVYISGPLYIRANPRPCPTERPPVPLAIAPSPANASSRASWNGRRGCISHGRARCSGTGLRGTRILARHCAMLRCTDSAALHCPALHRTALPCVCMSKHLSPTRPRLRRTLPTMPTMSSKMSRGSARMAGSATCKRKSTSVRSQTRVLERKCRFCHAADMRGTSTPHLSVCGIYSSATLLPSRPSRTQKGT
jgi:hypothetical protein